MPDMDAYMLRQLREEAARKAKEVEEEALKNPELEGVVVRPQLPGLPVQLPSPAEKTDLSVDKYAALGQVPEELMLEVLPIGARVEEAARKVLTKK